VVSKDVFCCLIEQVEDFDNIWKNMKWGETIWINILTIQC
jgi:hypothetical protein